jgi:peptide/nickel transport system permease protein
VGTYIARRLLLGLVIVFGVYTLAFFVTNAAPGDPFTGIQSPKMKPEDFERIRAHWGYDKPVVTRYFVQLGNLLQGDLGTSIAQKRPVSQLLADALPNTLLLSGTALVLEFILGVGLGILSAVKKGTRLDEGVTAATLFIYSMPGFWMAEMLVLVLAVVLGWLPSSGMHSVGAADLSFVAYVLDVGKHMVMPAFFVLGISGAAGIARFQRSAVLEVIRQDYVRTARAKGLDERTVIGRHALRNALIPVITLLGLSLPGLVSGAVITESIFAWPGMGQTVINAIPQRDVQVVTGFTLVASVMVVIGSLVSDICYALVDPRVRFS